jgi:hypothetical protein
VSLAGALRGALGIATLAAPAAIAAAVWAHARNVPWWDQWGLVPFMAEATQGRFPPNALWAEVNEHRIPVAMLLQGAIAWATRWDVRGDAWANVGVALGGLAALLALARRTLGRTEAAWVGLACSVLVFSPVAGVSWTAGWITPAFLAAALAALLAWLLARSRGTWLDLVVQVLVAGAGALSFGSGMLLVVLLPVAVLLRPGPLERRTLHALVAGGAGAALVWIYFRGWVPRPGHPPPVFHADRLDEYAQYALAYVGGAVGAAGLPAAQTWGGSVLVVLGAAGSWLWSRGPDLRAALVAWGLLALFGLGNGLVTAYGRLDNGAHTALLPRYAPTAGLFVASVAAVLAMLTGDLRRRSRAGAIAVILAIAVGVGLAGRPFAAASRRGFDQMASLARRLDAATPCLDSCAAATDRCLARICWDANVARRFCPLLERGRIGPFR